MRRAALVRLLARIAFVPAAFAVLVGSLTPGAEMPEIDVSDKLQHFAAYAGLAFLAALAWPHRRLLSPPVVGVLAAGPIVELLQLLVPGRSASIGDGVANAVGVAVGLALAALVRRLVPDPA